MDSLKIKKLRLYNRLYYQFVRKNRLDYKAFKKNKNFKSLLEYYNIDINDINIKSTIKQDNLTIEL